MSRFLWGGVMLLLLWVPASEASSQTVVAREGAPRMGDSVREARDGAARSSLLRPARLIVDAVPLATAVAELAERSGVLIAYSPSRLAIEGEVNCACETLTVAEALDHILASSAFRYIEVEGHIVIIPRTVALPASPQDLLPRLASPLVLAAVRPSRIPPRAAARVQQGSIAGVVTDAGTGEPLAGASIQIEGGLVEGITNSNGRYVMTNVAAGSYTLVASMIGYGSQRRTVAVTVGQATVVDFPLPVAPLRLDQLVVTATGDRRRTEVANVVGSVDADAIVAAVPIASMTQLLTARSPGVQVMSVGGTVGAQSRIRIRGQNSLSLSNDPIVYVDGVRVASGYGGGMDTSSRLDDLNPAEIRSIDVLKGPAAVALHGTDAANGVLLITTKRGTLGAPQWTISQESGITEQPSGFPAAYYSAGQRTDTGQATQCLLTGLAQGTCTQDELRSLNILEDSRSTPFATGRLNKTGVQLSGGAEWVRYFVSADFTDEVGTLRMPRDEQERLRAER
ncbi:MAG TPA: carboxypeptidase regulatory-like domain-containing protein, partial [Longimicrobiaceae bacterium]|nr:carboxypeptidase regulatory-like domain-containing protein [Longimicrobiaceae bacterium]